jgi:acyl-coenzyme A thioesterase PaaI-like protein
MSETVDGHDRPSPLDIPPSRFTAFESDDPRVRLAEALRTLLQHTATSSAIDADFERAAHLAEEAADILARGPHGRMYDGSAEGSVGGEHHGFLSHSPVTGPLNALAKRVHLETGEREVSATVTYGDAYEGPPGCLHGGFIAALFDEILGLAQALSGAPGMTGRLEITYRSPTPLNTPLRVVGRLESVQGRKILTSGDIHVGDRLCAEATGTFITVVPGTFSSLDLSRRRSPE